MTGRTCAGTLVTGTGVDGHPRRTYLYHVVDNEWSMREYGAQAVVWQTALNPVCALELLADGDWKGTGVLGPEAFPSQPYLTKLAELGAPHGVLELKPLSRRNRPSSRPGQTWLRAWHVRVPASRKRTDLTAALCGLSERLDRRVRPLDVVDGRGR